MLTNAGKDFISAQVGGSGGTSTAQYMALTSNNASPAATDTSLSGEFVGNGLDRALGTYAHTSGTSTYTISKVFTYTSTGSLTINKIGIFSAASGGTMVFESAITAATVAANGDQVSITHTVTLA